ncbi:MAG: ABC transporter ATP-binding protein [Solobacterium sp.]|jgi:oligopeptide/dipeptide ABC transporter, ATP-binding protein, C-terminal domain|uniref:ABC transporter ATP-binding protein n=1 Tax=uncultured Solobacterium sp. TaxID=747375 RepID=UPI001CB2321B|nr:ABC transporter ATP-binding protein [uncultured Solobacterium sp.]MBF1115441.1 ABC transporter ATP-binding protein [Solobacterium sp.]
MSQNTVLEIKDLEVELYSEKGPLPVIDKVNLSIKEGEIVGVVGESGCGKSMLASAIMNLLNSPAQIAAGTIFYEGQDMTTLSTKEFQKIRGNEISMIFQEPMTSLNPLMKVGKQIEEAIKAHEKVTTAELKERAIAAIRDVGIPQPEKVYHDIPSRLSGGMRQRIMIAMALVCHPKLLICDEPTTALDVTIQAQILRLIKKLRDETNTAVIFISHDMGVIYQMVDRVVVMYAGQFVESAPCKKLFEKPLHPYTIGLQNAIPQINKLQSSLQDIPGSVPMLDNLPEGCLFAPRCPFAKAECFTKKVPLKHYGDHDVRCLLVDEGGWHNE